LGSTIGVLVLVVCGASATGCGARQPATDRCAGIASHPAGVTSPPPLTFFFGAPTDATGTEINATNSATMLSKIANAGCGAFGIWEGGAMGEVAQELEVRFVERMGVFAMVDGVVTSIQPAYSPTEAGEVEGVWVRYGERFIVKYVHVTNPLVKVGDRVAKGQRIGETLFYSVATPPFAFWEAELRVKEGSSVFAMAWNDLLTNRDAFNALYGTGNCRDGGDPLDTDGKTPTTTSNWKNDRLPDGRWDATDQRSECDFAE
jgi:hypothetical protein